jgi:long-subunit acyl-CoA synthetase (AMP-forming)
MTYLPDTVAELANRLHLAAMFVTSDLLVNDTLQGSSESHPFWTLPAVLTATPSVKHIVVLNQSLAAVASLVTHAAFNNTRVTSLVDKVADAAMDAVVLPDPFLLNGCGDAHTTTVFFTSGSTGPPKGVLCLASAFVRDISDRVFSVPLVTPSYIPLSHTSDRMKMWEFLGNGGRVGFCVYAADNWIAHEVAKKVCVAGCFCFSPFWCDLTFKLNYYFLVFWWGVE